MNNGSNGFARFVTDFRTLLALFIVLGGWVVRAEVHMRTDVPAVPRTELEIRLENLTQDHGEIKEEIKELRRQILKLVEE
jgi:hypothetical protein